MHRKRKQFISFIIVLLLAAGCMSCKKEEPFQQKRKELQVQAHKDHKADKAHKKQQRTDTQTAKETTVSLYIYVCGAVNRPGVYEVPEGSRVFQAIELAGGMNEQADPNALNQAELLADAQRVYVPVAGEIGAPPLSDQKMDNQESPGEDATKEGQVNLNTASKEALMTLPGIGEAKANSILQYREQQGEFVSIEDIKQIEGIKDGVFQKIKDRIIV
ncbi:MAG: helix-hairpin-helix domain-containing protein [Lachnospiraceae bacterium]